MYCFRENSNFPFSNKKIITLVLNYHLNHVLMSYLWVNKENTMYHIIFWKEVQSPCRLEQFLYFIRYLDVVVVFELIGNN
jgi:hypothetical protein